MKSGVKILGHPVHPMLIVFPFGLLGTAVVFDLLFLLFNNVAFATVSYWLIAAGVIGGLLAAVFGLLDWLGIPSGTRAKSVGLLHGIGNVVVTLLFAASWLVRRGNADYAPGGFALVLSFLGIGLALFTGWLGGEMVYRLGVGVDRGAHPDAPNSLSGQPASAGKEDAAR